MRGAVVWAFLVACSSSPPAPTLITDVFNGSDLHVQGEMLYFRTQGAVWSMPAGGGPNATRLYDSECNGLTSDANALYFYGPKNADSTCDLMTGPLSGGTAVVLAPAVGPAPFAITDSLAVIVTDHVTTVPLSGGMPTVTATLLQSASHIVIAGPWVYWTVAVQNLPGCGAMAVAGGSPFSWSCEGSGEIAIDGSEIYVTQTIGRCPPCTTIWRSEASVSSPVTEVTHDDDNYLTDLRIRDHRLYWSDRVHIVRANLDGGDQTDIADIDPPTADSSLLDMTIDDTYVYWSPSYHAAIYRSPK